MFQIFLWGPIRGPARPRVLHEIDEILAEVSELILRRRSAAETDTFEPR